MITLENLLSSSVHLGHNIKQWNPKMAPFIYGERNNIHIIDIVQTAIYLEKAVNFVLRSASQNKKFLFVSTKVQFAPLIEQYATASNSFFITNRWLGGTLTNWFTIKECINKLKILEESEQLENSKVKLTKKEIFLLNKRKDRLNKFFRGLKGMDKLPDIVILIGQNNEIIAVKECLKMKITLISILDTNCDPRLTDFIIPANDDSISSISLILNELNLAISETN
uniref:Small ribosomal subunit protein uS2c n=1 Tax=Lepocinclis tripteris TaxID=135494 RepID=A0A3G3LKY8_9EUGL|nr:ribosomal protein S2 [Lepocinclis tripteris]AYQ93367.1 ribosomal protein S2 [Lepocinclis tripteris]